MEQGRTVCRGFEEKPYFGVPGVLRTQHLEPLTICLALRIVDITEESGSPLDACGVHGPKRRLALILSIATFHVTQGNSWVDGMPAGDAEDLQICVITVVLVVLLILSHSLLLSAKNDGLKLVESALHFLKAGAGALLLTADPLK